MYTFWGYPCVSIHCLLIKKTQARMWSCYRQQKIRYHIQYIEIRYCFLLFTLMFHSGCPPSLPLPHPLPHPLPDPPSRFLPLCQMTVAEWPSSKHELLGEWIERSNQSWGSAPWRRLEKDCFSVLHGDAAGDHSRDGCICFIDMNVQVTKPYCQSSPQWRDNIFFSTYCISQHITRSQTNDNITK